MRKHNFTLIEIMFVVGILVILIGIGGVAGNKILRKTAETKCKAEIKMLCAAVNQYKTRWGQYPEQSSGTSLDFAEHLSKVKRVDYTGPMPIPTRPMYIDFRSCDIAVDNSEYALINADPTTVLDPYEIGYFYLTNVHDHVASCSASCKIPESFFIYSVGLDAVI